MMFGLQSSSIWNLTPKPQINKLKRFSNLTTTMAGRRTLFNLSSSFSLHPNRFPFLTSLSKPTILLPPRFRFRPLSSITLSPEESLHSDQPKHSILLEKLRIRHIKDAVKTTVEVVKKNQKPEEVVKKKKVVVDVGSFKELGLSDEVMGAVRELGIEVPTEIQCIGVPSVLDGKSVVLGSHTGSGKTLAYLLPLVQVVSIILLNHNAFVENLWDPVLFGEHSGYPRVLLGTVTFW